MLGKIGLLHLAGLLDYINRNSGVTECTIMDHAFLPNRWCIGMENGRWVQVALVVGNDVVEIDYHTEGKGHVVLAVFDSHSVGARVLSYLRRETEEV